MNTSDHDSRKYFSTLWMLFIFLISHFPFTASNTKDLPILLVTSSFSEYRTTNVETDLYMAVNNLSTLLSDGYRFTAKTIQISKVRSLDV